MQVEEILNELNKIFIHVLDNESIVLTPQTVAGDIEDWDSLVHIQFIVAIEKNFRIKFTFDEIQKFNNVGDICLLIQKKLSI